MADASSPFAFAHNVISREQFNELFTKEDIKELKLRGKRRKKRNHGKSTTPRPDQTKKTLKIKAKIMEKGGGCGMVLQARLAN